MTHTSIHTATQFLNQIPDPTSGVVAPLAKRGFDTLHSSSPREPEMCKENQQSVHQYIKSLVKGSQPPG